MKKIIFLILFLVFVSNLFSQSSADPKHSIEHYLKKSKIQKTEAWVLSGGGAASVLTSLLISRGEKLPEGLCIFHCAE
jgi:hypothetical protein